VDFFIVDVLIKHQTEYRQGCVHSRVTNNKQPVVYWN